MSIFKKIFGRPTNESQKNEVLEEKLDGSRGDIILEFHNSIQKSIEWDKLDDVEFAMWLPCEKDNNFRSSEIVKKWTVIYSLTKDYWAYISADLLKALKIVDEETFRLDLPDNFQAFAFLTKDNEQIILSLSKEKGIRFHFSETTSFEDRKKYLDKFILYCKAWSGLIDLNNGEKDNDIGFAAWWDFTMKASLTVEQNEPLTGVGKIIK